MKKIFDQTFSKGVVDDDSVAECLRVLNSFSRKPDEREAEQLDDDIGELSYYTVYDKKFRIVVYSED